MANTFNINSVTFQKEIQASPNLLMEIKTNVSCFPKSIIPTKFQIHTFFDTKWRTNGETSTYMQYLIENNRFNPPGVINAFVPEIAWIGFSSADKALMISMLDTLMLNTKKERDDAGITDDDDIKNRMIHGNTDTGRFHLPFYPFFHRFNTNVFLEDKKILEDHFLGGDIEYYTDKWRYILINNDLLDKEHNAILGH